MHVRVCAVLLADGLMTWIGVSHVVDSVRTGRQIDISFHSPCDGRAHSSKPFS
jgi:hypothetical protein